MLNMNIEYIGRLHEAEKTRRFAGKVYDRIARPSRIMLFAFIAAAGVVEVLSCLRGGHLDYYLVFLLALLFSNISQYVSTICVSTSLNNS